MELYGKKWKRRDLEARVGRLEQVGGIRRFALTEGPDAGCEQIEVRTGAGLAYHVSPTRGMDISLAEFCGSPISWQGQPGNVHPSYYDASGKEWLRTAAGGLLMTCGLTQVGTACEDGGEDLGVHGRVHHIAAREVAAEGRWKGDEYEMRAAGVVEEAAIFGEYVRLTREIVSRLGENTIRITDVVENIGFNPCPHMILYHFNFGFPLMSDDTRITFPSASVFPRDKGVPLEGYDRWQAPEAGLRERVYYHEDFREDEGRPGWATVAVENPRFPAAGSHVPLSVRVSWETGRLNRLVQWKMPGESMYVLGIEPSNCHVEGRAAERTYGTLVMMEPGGREEYRLEVSVR